MYLPPLASARQWIILLVALANALPLGGMLRAEEIEVATIDHPDPVDFQRELLPILRKKCLACHNATDSESDLILETPASILQGGLEGPAVVAGQPDESLLFLLAGHVQEPIMPPADNDVGAAPFEPSELALLKLWIEQGAKGDVAAPAKAIEWQPLPPGVNPVFAAAQPDNGRFVAIGRANQIWIYDVLLGRYVDRLIDPDLSRSPAGQDRTIAHLDLVQSLAFSHDGQRIASGGYRTVKLWRQTSPMFQTQSLPSSPVVCQARRGELQIRVFADATVQSQEGNSDPIVIHLAEPQPTLLAAAVSPDGQSIATIGDDQHLRISKRVDGQLLSTTAITDALNRLVWTPAGDLVASGQDAALRVWKVDADSMPGDVAVVASDGGAVSSLAALADHRVAVGDVAGKIRVWDLAQSKLEREFDQAGPVSALVLSDDAQHLVSLGPAAPAKLWDLSQGKLIADLAGNPALQWEVDQRQLEEQIAKRQVDNLTADLDAAKKRVTDEEANLKKTQEARDKAQQESDAAVEAASKAVAERDAAQQALATAQEQAKLTEAKLADAASDDDKATAQKALEEAQQAVKAAEEALKPKREAAEKAETDRIAKEQTLDSAKRSVETSERALADAQTQSVALDPQLKQAQDHHQAAEMATKQATERQQADRPAARLASFTPDGSLLATGDTQGTVLIWNSDDGKLVAPLSAAMLDVTGLSFVNSEVIESLGEDATLRRYRLDTRWQLERVIGSPDETSSLSDRVTALAFSPDDRLLAVGGGEPSRGGELKLYNAEDGQLVREIENAHSDTVLAVAFSPDGTLLATGGADRFMKLFRVDDGSHVRTFEGHTHHVLSVAWRADGRVLVSGGADKLVKLWNVSDGSQIRTIQGFGKEVTSLIFAGAQDRFFAACGDQNLYRCEVGGERKSIGRGDDFLYVATVDRLGKQVAFGGHDSVVRIVDEDGKQRAEAK